MNCTLNYFAIFYPYYFETCLFSSKSNLFPIKIMVRKFTPSYFNFLNHDLNDLNESILVIS